MRFKILPFLLPLFLHALPGYYEPWGKDADLKYPTASSESASLSPLGQVMQHVIQFHQKIISPADGPRSHFKPSSSQYMLEAIRKHGFFKGYIMGCDRLMRENKDPWVYRTAVINGQIWKTNPVN
jgi:putative component of membrane protein insertase Oxa1/YidC/SpoIIIJ protein YidD